MYAVHEAAVSTKYLEICEDLLASPTSVVQQHVFQPAFKPRSLADDFVIPIKPAEHQHVRVKRKLPDFIIKVQGKLRKQSESKKQAAPSTQEWNPPPGIKASQSLQIGEHVTTDLTPEEEAVVNAAISSGDAKVCLSQAASLQKNMISDAPDAPQELRRASLHIAPPISGLTVRQPWAKARSTKRVRPHAFRPPDLSNLITNLVPAGRDRPS